jgi:lipoprotein-releasing system permease protein
MQHIAAIAVAVSIAVALISSSVMVGFRNEITSLVSSTVSDIVVAPSFSMRQPELHPVTDSEALRTLITTTDNVSHIEPYAVRGGVLRSKRGAEGIVIKGIGVESDFSYYTSRLILGDMLRIEEARRKELLLSESVASKLHIESGDRVELLIIEGDTPRRELFKVCGIYRSALGDIGAEIALTDLRNVQKINGWQSGTLSGFEIRTSEGVDNYLLSEQINNSLFEDYTGDANLSSVSAEQLYSNIFTWLETHDINATVIITIMFIVALFNMITALLIMLFERTRMVGILKSLGMSNSSIRKIFLYQAARVITIGLIVGNAIAIVLILVQKYTGVIKLDSSAYFVSQVPVSIGVVEILIINTIFATAILALLFAVTAIVSQIKPSEAVKYE